MQNLYLISRLAGQYQAVSPARTFFRAGHLMPYRLPPGVRAQPAMIALAQTGAAQIGLTLFHVQDIVGT